MKNKVLFLLLLAVSTVLAGFIINDNPEDKYQGVSQIKSENLMKTVEFLASPELEGRLGGGAGYYKAAVFMADEFRKLGLKPAGDDLYFQYFNVEYNEILSARFSLNTNGTEKTYKLGDDYVCRGFTGSGNYSGDVVFAGYGFSEAGYDDYAGIDVKDKAVLIFKQTPSWKTEGTGWNQSLRYRGAIALKKGAKAVIFVSKPNDRNPQKPIGSVADGEGEHLYNLPMIHIDLSIADELLSASGKNIKELQAQIDDNKMPSSFVLGTSISLDVKASYTKNKKTMNIAGILEGSDDNLKDEYIIIGAHLDHAGSQAGEIYFPGANDDASGSASVLEIGRTFVNAGVKPKRSILFILFSNEESGMHGSGYYTEHPLVPLEKTVAMLNNDCVAHGDSIQIGNGNSCPVLWKITRGIDSIYTKSMMMRTWKGGGADAGPFHSKGVPSLYFVSYYSYTHLHLMSDKLETLNPVLFENICKLGYMTAYEVAMGNYKREEVVN